MSGYSTREQRQSRRRQRNDEAEARLQADSAQHEAEMMEIDPHGVTAAVDNMRVMGEDAAEDLQEHQLNAALVAERQQEEQRERAQRAMRRQDYYEHRRRGVRELLRRELGREPTVPEFMRNIAHLVLDRNWSDDE
jgi:hypothetical protein